MKFLQQFLEELMKNLGKFRIILENQRETTKKFLKYVGRQKSNLHRARNMYSYTYCG